MVRFQILAGSTSQDIVIPAFDSSSAVGAKLAGLTFETASLTAYYSRQGAAGAATAISLATKTKGTWATGGFVAVDGTNMPGDYELGVPDAALAAGAAWVKIQLKGAANMVPIDIFIDLALKPANMTQILGTAVATPATAGLLDVNVKQISTDAAAADNLETACDGGSFNIGGGGAVAASVTGAVGSVTGAVGSVTGAVGSVTGNVGGNVTGSIGTVAANGIAAASIATGAITNAKFAAGAIDAAAIATGAIDADSIAADAIAAAKIATGAITAAKFAAGAIDAAAIADAAIDSATFAAGAITAAAIAADAIGASELAADAVAEIADAVWDELRADHTGAGTFGEVTEAADLVDDIWDEDLTGHVVADSAGEALAAAGLAADPWDVALPGAYGAGTAGKIIGDNIDGPVSDVQDAVDAAAADVTTILGTDLPAVKTVVDAVLVDTGTTLDGRIPASLVSGRIDASVGAMAANVLTASALAADAVDEILDEVVEGSTTLRQAVRLFAAALAGKSSGGGSNTLIFRDLADTLNRITATVDEAGNRTGMTTNLA